MQLRTTAIAKGGEAIAREPSGRVVFVSGALPDETVEVSITEERKEFARAEVTSVIEASPDRVEPPCPYVAAGCGGCDLQHVSESAQLKLKQDIVIDVLRKIGRFEEAPDIAAVPLAPFGYRTTVKGQVVNGKFAFQRRSSNDALAIEECLIAHPLLADLIKDGDFANARTVTLRCGARTGDRLALFEPRIPKAMRLPADVVVAGSAEVRGKSKGNPRAKLPFYTEEVAGHLFRISATSFFQVRAGGAEALVDAVSAAVGPIDSSTHMADLYGGVGLFAATVGANAGRVTLVEQHATSVHDAKVNLAGRNVRLLAGAVEDWPAERVDVVVADPARAGLGRKGVDQIAATHAERVALVSCDPAAFARDAALLVAAGYSFDTCTIVDMFPQTSHIELVSGFTRRQRETSA